jgi:hypothetical protein
MSQVASSAVSSPIAVSADNIAGPNKMLTVANSTFLVEGNFRRKHSITTLAAVALPQVAAVLFSSGTLVMMSNITIRCLDIPSASSSLFDIRSVVYGCAVSVALVALRQSSAPGEALINLSHAGNASVSDTALTSTISSSTDNVVEIPHECPSSVDCSQCCRGDCISGTQWYRRAVLVRGHNADESWSLGRPSCRQRRRSRLRSHKTIVARYRPTNLSQPTR